MSITEEATFDAPAKKRSAKKKGKARTAPPREPKSIAPFPGLTRTACADACNANGCAISGKSYCGHPTKGGLQPVDMGDSAALKRIQNARDQISIRLDPDRFK